MPIAHLCQGLTEKQSGRPFIFQGAKVSKQASRWLSGGGVHRVALLHFCFGSVGRLDSAVSIASIVHDHLHIAYNIGADEKRLFYREMAFDLFTDAGLQDHRKHVLDIIPEMQT
jgi:hypothetical protein